MLVQEYVSGGSLHRILQNKAIELLWPTRVRMALEIAQALLFLHSRNVLHRDLKAENVLIESGPGDVAGKTSFGRCKVRLASTFFFPSRNCPPLFVLAFHSTSHSTNDHFVCRMCFDCLVI